MELYAATQASAAPSLFAEEVLYREVMAYDVVLMIHRYRVPISMMQLTRFEDDVRR